MRPNQDSFLIVVVVFVMVVMANSCPSPKHMVRIGDGFYHLRGTFRKGYVLNIGTHMALARLNDGKFCVLDAIKLSQGEKDDIDMITQNGALIDSVICMPSFI